MAAIKQVINEAVERGKYSICIAYQTQIWRWWCRS